MLNGYYAQRNWLDVELAVLWFHRHIRGIEDYVLEVHT